MPIKRFDLRFGLVLACFALSGFAGLLYETTWTREFSFVFGTSGLAVSTVLAAYMGGLALGSSLAGRYVDRIRRPVLAYGLLELGIALSALAVPWAIASARTLHVGLLRGVTDPGSRGALALYLATSFVILCVPTTFMGATLPLLARHAVRSDEQVGPRIGALYSINTAGAIFGTLVTAFILMPELGLRKTVYVGATLNGIVFLGAWALSRSDRGPGLSDTQRSATEVRVPSESSASTSLSFAQRLVLAMACAAGIASFTYEVMWVRLLEHMLGGSVYAFAAMLGSFLIGIAGGGAFAARFAKTRDHALPGLALTQLLAAGLSLLAYRGVALMPGWLGDRSVFGDVSGLIGTATVGALVLLPSTLCIGAMFPFAVRALAPDADTSAGMSARVYTWNTLGAIVGSISTGFFLLPLLGFAGTVAFAALLNLAVAATAWTLSEKRPRSLAAIFAGIVLLALVFPPQTPWSLLRTMPLDPAADIHDDDKHVLFHAIGRSASVLAVQTESGIRIRTNGMPESNIDVVGERPGRIATGRWLGVVPALAPNQIDRMLVIGLGGSVALEAIPLMVKQIEVVELEPEVVAANRAVDHLRVTDVAADKRIVVKLGDARSVLELSGEPFDAIVSQPSHAWTSGSSHLYTRDFFERVRGRLAEDGVFVQWLGLPFVDEPLLRSFVATLGSVFPNVRLYRPTWTGALFIASSGPLDLESRFEEIRAKSPEEFRRVGLRDVETLLAALTLDEAGSRAFGAGAPMITDDFNSMATQAPWVKSLPRASFDAMFLPYDPLTSRLEGVRPTRIVDAFFNLNRLDYASAWVRKLPKGPTRTLAQGRVAEMKSRLDSAIRRYRSIPDGTAEATQARWALARLSKSRFGTSDPSAISDFDFPSGTPQALIVEVWRALEAQDLASVMARDSALAVIDNDDVTYTDAARARIEWRLLTPTAEHGREALELIDRLEALWTIERLVDRAYAAALAGNEFAARDSLRELTLPPAALAPASVTRLRAAYELIPRTEANSEELDWLGDTLDLME